MKIDYASGAIRAAAAIFVAGLAFVTGAAIAASAQEPEDQPAVAFKRVCSSCHDAERILGSRRTRTQWEEVIEKMIERGPQEPPRISPPPKCTCCASAGA